MHPYPHLYVASAAAGPSGSVSVTSPRLPEIATAPPAEFDGPGRCLVAGNAVRRRDRRLLHPHLSRPGQGVPLRVDPARAAGSRACWTAPRASRSSPAYTTYATLEIPPAGDAGKARTLLEKSEHRCLVANSLRGTRSLVAEVVHAT